MFLTSVISRSIEYLFFRCSEAFFSNTCKVGYMLKIYSKYYINIINKTCGYT